MPNTTNRGYSVPTTGSQSGIWGSDDLNPNFSAIDQNLGAIATVDLSAGNVILSSAEYVCGTIKLTGALTNNVTVTFPSSRSCWWTVYNTCTGSSTYYINLSCGAGNKICPPPGYMINVQSDGSGNAFYYRDLPHMIGSYWIYSGAVVPTWVSGCTVPPYLICDGSTFSAITYPYLNEILGGTTLPDLRGRSMANLNGGTGRITTAGSGVNGDTRLSAGGSETVTLTSAQMPTHTHTLTTNGAHTHTVGPITTSNPNQGSGGSVTVYVPSAGTLTTSSNGDHTHTVGNAGSSSAHNNVHPVCITGITLIRAG